MSSFIWLVFGLTATVTIRLVYFFLNSLGSETDVDFSVVHLAPSWNVYFVTSGQLFVFCAEMKIAVPLDVDNKPEALHLEYYFRSILS